MQRSTFTSLSMFAVTGLAAILLVGCSSSPSSEPSISDTGAEADNATAAETENITASDENETNSSDSEGTAVLSYGDTSYSAELQFCLLSGDEDALFHGVAYDEAGVEVGYLDGDFGGLSDIPDGEARIDLGATAKLQSTDEFIAMGSVGGHIVITDFSETSLIVVGPAWDQAGTKLPTATLKVTC